MVNPAQLPPFALWARGNGFIIGLILAVVLAFLLPAPGAHGGALHPELVNEFGVALILLLQGLTLALEKVRQGLSNWRLHLVIQAFTFLVFPVVGMALSWIVPAFWRTEPPTIRDGFLYLCVLPSTVSTSVVLTSLARGNTAGALFNAILSNIAGVILTPVLVHLLMRTTGQSGSFLPLLIKISLLTLLPFAIGMILRHWLVGWIEANKMWALRLSNAVILFIVYSAFCDSVQSRIWSRYGLEMVLAVIALVVLLFAGMSLLIALTCRLLQLSREDFIAAYFCSVKKTLAMGVPLAILIFGPRSDLSLILLPTMLYHPLQLFVNSLLASRWARQS